MKKAVFLILISTVVLSCSKNAPFLNNSDNLDAAPKVTYDTVAIDSFGPGATPESVMAKINAIAIKREKDSLAKIAKAEQEKLDKEKAKLEAEKAKEEKEKAKTTQSSSTENPQTNP